MSEFMITDATVVAKEIRKVYKPKQTVKDFISKRNVRSFETRGVRALNTTSFVAKRGESIGILGRNGSGKSTLLRIIAGSELPTSGEVLVSSQPAHLGVGSVLQSDLSGRDNIELGLLSKGLSPKEVDSYINDVAVWAGIEKAIDRPLRTYSSGMRARLKFSIATTMRSEILLVDEALATGDSAFVSRAEERMAGLLAQDGTVFMVSHGTMIIQKNCTRVIWLHDGNIVADGDPDEIGPIYRKWSMLQGNNDLKEAERLFLSTKAMYSRPNISLINLPTS